MKSWDDIEALAASEPSMHHAIKLLLDGTLTKEQALIEMVTAIVDQKQYYFNELADIKIKFSHYDRMSMEEVNEILEKRESEDK